MSASSHDDNYRFKPDFCIVVPDLTSTEINQRRASAKRSRAIPTRHLIIILLARLAVSKARSQLRTTSDKVGFTIRHRSTRSQIGNITSYRAQATVNKGVGARPCENKISLLVLTGAICRPGNSFVIETASYVRPSLSCRDPKFHQDIGCQACSVYNCCTTALASSENFPLPIQFPRSRPVPSYIAACPSQSLETRFCLVVCPPPPFPLVSRFLCLSSH